MPVPSISANQQKALFVSVQRSFVFLIQLIHCYFMLQLIFYFSQFFVFPLFWGTEMYSNEFETKITEIKN